MSDAIDSYIRLFLLSFIRNSLFSRAFLALILLTLSGCKFHSKTRSDLAASNSDLPTPINSSILMMGNWEYKLEGRKNVCMAQVDRILSSGTRHQTINFVPTHYFHAKVDEAGLLSASDFCHSRTPQGCRAFTADNIGEFRDGMAACFAHAVASGANLAITPHLDDGDAKGVWRNNVIIDPIPDGDTTCANNTTTYYCTMLKPLADAVQKAVIPGTKVFFSTQGEMGATVFRYPNQYTKILSVIKSQIVEKYSPLNVSDIQVGLALNHESIFGKVPITQINAAEVRTLLKSSDFLGVSAYLQADPYPFPAMFDDAFNEVNHELGQIGIDLKIDTPNLAFAFTEIGIGGGIKEGQAGRNRKECTGSTWDGIGSAYDVSKDPWQISDCRAARREFYCAAQHYLSEPFTWKIRQAYIWNSGSWDVQGISPGATASDGKGYGDPDIIKSLAEYNSTGKATCATNAAPRSITFSFPELETYSAHDQSSIERSYTVNSGGGPFSMSLTPSVGNASGTGALISFRIGDGGTMSPPYAGAARKITPPPQAAAATGIGFHLAYAPKLQQSTLAKRYFVFQITDQSGHIWEFHKTLDQKVDEDVRAIFSEMKPPCSYSGPSYGLPQPTSLINFSFYINGALCNESSVASTGDAMEQVSVGSLTWLTASNAGAIPASIPSPPPSPPAPSDCTAANQDGRKCEFVGYAEGQVGNPWGISLGAFRCKNGCLIYIDRAYCSTKNRDGRTCQEVGYTEGKAGYPWGKTNGRFRCTGGCMEYAPL